MIRFFLTCFFGLWSVSQVSAQLSAGSKFVGGSLGYTMDATPDRTDNLFYTGYSIYPKVGFFVKDRLALGVSVGYGYGFREDDSFTYGRITEETTTYSIGTSLTWYFPVSEEKFWFTIDGGVGYSRNFQEYSYPVTPNYFNSESYSIGVGISPGFLFFPSPRWGVTLSLGDLLYRHRHGIGNEISENEVLLRLGRFSLGVIYFFR